MAEDGEEKLLATVQRIVQTLGSSDTMTEDILKVFSNYDGRLSLDKLYAARAAAAAAAAGGGDGGGGDHSMPASPPLPPPPQAAVSAAAARPPVTSMERTVRALDRQISQFVAMDRLIWADSADADAFLEAVDDLIGTVQELDAAGTNRVLLDRADELLSRCMARLEDEFRALIERPDDAAPVAPGGFGSDGSGDEEDYGGGHGYGDEPIPIAKPVTDYDVVIDALSPGSVANVHQIARRMVDAGFGRECAEAYAAARRGFVDESVARLGVRPHTAEEVHASPWEELEFEIARWIPAFNMVFRILIPSERRLCDRVFDGLAPFGDLAFVAAVRTQALQLISFGDAISSSSRAPERLFRVVDMYEAVRDLLPDLDPVFSDPYSAALRAEVSAVCNTLGSSIKGIFMELENLIRRDPARVAAPGGGIHPITRYVMNYLRAACGSRQTLEEVMGDFGAVGGAAIAVDPDRPTSSLAVHIAWIMDVLHKNLDAKSKIYRDPSLACVFLMNNGKYIIHKVNDSELGVLLGDEWIKQMTSRVRHWSMDYQRTTWSKVTTVLQTGGPGVGGLPGKVMLQKLRMFNTYIEEICAVQSEWVIADDQLRVDVRAAVADSVIPVYTGLIARLKSSPETGRDLYIKYTPEDVEARIQHLFEGSSKVIG